MDIRQEQIEIAERMQLKWLRHAERLLDSNEITSTDFKTIYQALRDNGWLFDASKLPQGLKDKLTTVLSFDDEDDDVIPLRGTG
jgi:hypothetical protein